MVARSRRLCYDFSELIADCSVPGRVFVRKKAKDHAKCHYNLETESRILGFLSLDDFPEIEHDNTDVLDEGPDAGITFDAYTFKIGQKYVYFAFYRRPNGKWVVKSFHPPEVGDKAPSLCNNAFKLLENLKL